jgi:hypothetical protein
VQWKPPGTFMNGYIEFSMGGANEKRSSFGSATTSAANNENAVLVMQNQAADMQVLRDAVEEALGGISDGPSVSVPSVDPMARLRQLGELRDAGVVTSVEFESKKAEMLGRL